MMENDPPFEIKIDETTVGVALLVFNSKYQDSKKYKKLPPSHTVNADGLAELFRGFGYAVYKKEDVPSVQRFKYYCDVVANYKYKYSKCKRILIYFSGYGDRGDSAGTNYLVMGDDDENTTQKLDVNEIIKWFDPKNNGKLTNMARMFFIDKTQLVVNVDDDKQIEGAKSSAVGTSGMADDEPWSDMVTVPSEGNTLLACASYNFIEKDLSGKRIMIHTGS